MNEVSWFNQGESTFADNAGKQIPQHQTAENKGGVGNVVGVNVNEVFEEYGVNNNHHQWLYKEPTNSQ